jgi:hypothetical protein
MKEDAVRVRSPTPGRVEGIFHKLRLSPLLSLRTVMITSDKAIQKTITRP